MKFVNKKRLSRPQAIKYLAQKIVEQLHERRPQDHADVRYMLSDAYGSFQYDLTQETEKLLKEHPPLRPPVKVSGKGVPYVLRKVLVEMGFHNPPFIFGDLWKDKIHRRYKVWGMRLDEEDLETFEHDVRSKLGNAVVKVYMHTARPSAWKPPGQERSLCVLVDVTKLRV